MVAAADEAVADALRRQGWSVLTKGWPDLLCYNDRTKKVMAVELKRGVDKLRPDQTAMMRVFTDLLAVPFHVARDDDIATVMRRKGRAIAPGTRSLATLDEELATVAGQVEWLQKMLIETVERLEELEQGYDGSTLVFETPRPVSENQEQVRVLAAEGAATWL
jgi:hypothetical protein